MKVKLKVVDCPNCGRSVDVTDENGENDICCMVCCEFFWLEDAGEIREIEIEKSIYDIIK